MNHRLPRAHDLLAAHAEKHRIRGKRHVQHTARYKADKLQQGVIKEGKAGGRMKKLHTVTAIREKEEKVGQGGVDTILPN